MSKNPPTTFNVDIIAINPHEYPVKDTQLRYLINLLNHFTIYQLKSTHTDDINTRVG